MHEKKAEHLRQNLSLKLEKVQRVILLQAIIPASQASSKIRHIHHKPDIINYFSASPLTSINNIMLFL